MCTAFCSTHAEYRTHARLFGNDVDDVCSLTLSYCSSLQDLICYKRFGRATTPSDALVPGCAGLDYSKTDWCVAP